MIDIILLNIILIIIFLLTLVLKTHTPNLKYLQKVKTSIPTPFIIIFSLIYIFFILYLLSSGSFQSMQIYLTIIFSLSIIGFSFWISFGKPMITKIISILLAIAFIILRFISPSNILHSIFLILAVMWLGPFLIQTGIIIKKRFTFISVVWFFYDIVFILASTISQNVHSNTKAVGIPLAMVIGNTYFGIDNLFWISLFVPLLKNKLVIIMAIMTLIIVNFLIYTYLYVSTSATELPTLFLWLPLGVLFLKLDEKIGEKN